MLISANELWGDHWPLGLRLGGSRWHQVPRFAARNRERAGGWGLRTCGWEGTREGKSDTQGQGMRSWGNGGDQLSVGRACSHLLSCWHGDRDTERDRGCN